MSPVSKNIAANFAGSFWNALIGLIFVPLYIKFMGIEAYGLVGVFASLLTLLSVLDLGLSATMTREMARLSAVDPSGSEMRGLTRTLEVIYWAVALFLGIAVIALAGPIAHYWVKTDRLEPAAVKQALMITGGVIALQWPTSFYAGGLRGLDRQPMLNFIESACATFRGFGAVAVLWLISPTIRAFFCYQIIVSAVQTFWLAVSLWRVLPGHGSPARIEFARLTDIWRFSAGMTAISAAGLLLTQADKIILSRMLSLELFGYYILAWTVTGTLLRIIYPIELAVYPTLTRFVAEKNEQALRNLYHQSCQMQTVLLVPAALVLILFGDAVLTVWSSDPAIVRNTGYVLGILAIGTCLNGFMHIPYWTTLAYGWTSLAYYQNIISVIILVPLIILFTQWYQGIGAAYVWVIFNAGIIPISIHVIHGRILKGAKWDWYLYDIGFPTLAALLTSSGCRVIMPSQLSTVSQTAYILASAGFSCLAAVLAAPFPREKFLEAGRILLRQLSVRSS